MSRNTQQSNKDRSSNFCKEETNKLMLLLRDYPVITCKRTDHASNQQKDAAWRLLTENFNSDATKYRSTKQLQQKYNNMKKTARKEMAAEKYGRRQTGGGPAPPQPSETTEWLNSIMGESISGRPAEFDSDILESTLVDVHHETVNLDTTVNISLDLLDDKECMPKTSVEVKKDIAFSGSEDMLKEIVPNNNGLSKLNAFDSSTPKAMLRKPVAKELTFKEKKRKTTFTPLETRKRIIMHTERKIDFLTQKQLRENELSQYAKEEHELNMKHKQELHEQELEFKKKMYDLKLEKCKYETEKAKLDFNKKQVVLKNNYFLFCHVLIIRKINSYNKV